MGLSHGEIEVEARGGNPNGIFVVFGPPRHRFLRTRRSVACSTVPPPRTSTISPATMMSELPDPIREVLREHALGARRLADGTTVVSVALDQLTEDERQDAEEALARVLGTVPIDIQDVSTKGAREGSRTVASFRRTLVIPIALLDD
jgi:hypothetical protein